MIDIVQTWDLISKAGVVGVLLIVGALIIRGGLVAERFYLDMKEQCELAKAETARVREEADKRERELLAEVAKWTEIAIRGLRTADRLATTQEQTLRDQKP